MSFGKGGQTTYQTQQITPEQQAQIKAATDFFTGTVKPALQQALGGATSLYEQSAPGVTNAAQNLAQQASQAQQTLGGTGESALRTGITGLENLFGPQYEQQQLQAALQPAQAQYMQNLANQAAQFGSAGQLGSARSALAQAQTAGQALAAQQQAAAQVEQNIAAQRLAAGQALTGAGQQNIGQALGAAGQQVTAAMTPQQLFNQYASVLFGTPAQSYIGQFGGTQGSTQNVSRTNFGISI